MPVSGFTEVLQRRETNGRLAVLVGLIAAVAACLMIWSTPAKAEDGSLSVSLDTGVINLGSTTGVKVVDPANTPPDPPATLNATLTDAGAVSTPPAGFNFPTKMIKNLETDLLTVDATIEIAASAAITGTFDRDTGDANLSIPAQARISVSAAGDTGEPLAICKVSGFTLDLATTGMLVDPGVPGADPPHPPQNYPAAPFDPEDSGDGAVVAEGPTGLPASVPDGGQIPEGICPAVDGLIGGPGGIWMSGTATPSAGPVQLPPTLAPAITAGPENPTTATEATFDFEAGAAETEPVTGFQCRLDSDSGASWSACGSGTYGSVTYNDLAVGDHEFDVRAVNDIGPGPATSQSWTVETPVEPIAPPTAAPKIVSGPAAETTETNAAFTFEKGSGEQQPVDAFECRLDSAAWAACDSGSVSYSGLEVGAHKFEVRAGNEAGVGPVASASWKVTEVPIIKTCADDPTLPSCVGRIGSLKVAPKMKRVKRGKKVAFKVTVKNSGDGFAQNLKICAKAPKKQLKAAGGKCKKIAKLAPGKSARVTLRLKVTRKAKVGKVYKVRFRATGPGLQAKRGVGKVKIRR